MQIHDLNTGTPASGHYIAMDSGSDTYKATPGNVVPSYTSGDSSSASSWTSVTAVGTGLSFSTLINRITTMMKNVRYLYTLLGTTSISGIGNGTVTGALSTLNSKLIYSRMESAIVASSATNKTKVTITVGASGQAYGMVLVSCGPNLFWQMLSPNATSLNRISGNSNAPTLAYNSSTFTFTITFGTEGQILVIVGGGLARNGTVTIS